MLIRIHFIINPPKILNKLPLDAYPRKILKIRAAAKVTKTTFNSTHYHCQLHGTGRKCGHGKFTRAISEKIRSNGRRNILASL